MPTLLRAMRATAAGRPGIWRVAAVLLLVEIVVAFVVRMHEAAPGGLAAGWLIKPVHAVLSIWTMIAFYRAILAPQRSPWQPDKATVLFSGGAAIELALAVATIWMARLWTAALLDAADAGPRTTANVGAAAFTLVALAVTIGFLRTQPWLAALAVGRRDMNVQRSWAETAGRGATIVVSWLLLLAPLVIAYALVELRASHPKASGNAAIEALLVAVRAALVTTIALVSTLHSSTVLKLIDGQNLSDKQTSRA